MPQGPYNAIGLITPAEFYPNGELTFDQSVAQGVEDLDKCISVADCGYDVGDKAPTVDDTFVAFGYSQSATIGTFEKRRLAAEYPDGGGRRNLRSSLSAAGPTDVQMVAAGRFDGRTAKSRNR
jgi:hypothetical protein